LVRRVHERIGYVPIHVGLVAQTLPLAHMPRYRSPVRLLPRPSLHGSSERIAPVGQATP
jgi:hypothetical protein